MKAIGKTKYISYVYKQNMKVKCTCLPSHKPSYQEKQDIPVTSGEAGTNSKEMLSCGFQLMDKPVLADQQKLASNSSVQTLDPSTE